VLLSLLFQGVYRYPTEELHLQSLRIKPSNIEMPPPTFRRKATLPDIVNMTFFDNEDKIHFFHFDKINLFLQRKGHLHYTAVLEVPSLLQENWNCIPSLYYYWEEVNISYIIEQKPPAPSSKGKKQPSFYILKEVTLIIKKGSHPHS